MNLKLCFAVTLALSAMGVHAAAPATLQEAAERAITNNPELRARWFEFRASTEDVSAARGGYLPQVDFQAYAGREWQMRPSGDTGGFNHPGATLSLRQMLFDGFATSNEVQRLGYARLTRYYELLSSSDQIAYESVRAYQDVLRYRELVALAQDNYALHKEILGQIEERVKAGVGRRVDLEQASGRLALAESNWLTDLSNLHDVSARFQRIVGEAPAATLAPAQDLRAALPKEGSAVLATALKQNPSFLAAVSNIRSARSDAETRKSNNYPKLELVARQAIDRDRDNISGTFQDRTIQLNLNYNLFSGGRDSARIRGAVEKLNSAYELRDKTCRDIRQTTQIAWNDVRRLNEQMKFLDQHQLSTEKSRDAYRKQFDIGQRTLLDLLDTENELFTAKRAVVAAVYDLKTSEAGVLTQTHQILAALKLAPLEAAVPEDLDDSQLDDERIRCSAEMPEAYVMDREGVMANRPPLAPIAVPEALSAPVNKDLVQFGNDLVDKWSKAWAEKRVDDYLVFYANSFVPSNGMSVDKWKEFRRSRIAKQGNLSITLDKMQLKQINETQAEASFEQSYKSKDYTDAVHKTLEMVKQGGQWKIKAEKVTSGKAY
ncbi:TolC family outer membrane protein [Iodobacter ciconiae]|uniref:Channel protein TolC n=1 Tax=Iodobacter ciconiae TaxID=2496266 RepID=A0A3S8ZUZ8_9NEIS|nr:TolC family outer membrane protein [Iodobacter ciconiae]AZN37281.1 channel protein TolC [Iodobacter ciconiae]